jgi:hypothetical protein
MAKALGYWIVDLLFHKREMENTVAQLIQTLCYKQKGRGFDFSLA